MNDFLKALKDTSENGGPSKQEIKQYISSGISAFDSLLQGVVPVKMSTFRLLNLGANTTLFLDMERKVSHPPFCVGQRVRHIKDDVEGVVLSIDYNIPHPTTCRVHWDDDTNPEGSDTQWTNKLIGL
jgi:hypothetical protein